MIENVIIKEIRDDRKMKGIKRTDILSLYYFSLLISFI